MSGVPRVNVSWTPPLASQLNFTVDEARCNIAAKFLASFAQLYQDNSTDGALDKDMPGGIIVQYLNSTIPTNFPVKPTSQDLSAWYWSWLIDDSDATIDSINKILDFPALNCDKAVCSALDWEGDPDISGIGMMVSYYLALIFASIYFVVLTVTSIKCLHRDRARAEKLKSRTFISIFRETLSTFLDSALIFCISMLGAAITRYSSYIKHPENHQSLYALFGSVFMSGFSILLCIIIQTLAGTVRRHWLRMILWTVILALAITLAAMYWTLYYQQEWSGKFGDIPNPNFDWGQATRQSAQAIETLWLKRCDPHDLRKALEQLSKGSHVILGLNFIWWLHSLFASLVPSSLRRRINPQTKGWKLWRNTKRVLKVIDGVICLVFAWVLLGFFHSYRYAVSQSAGNSDEDSKWTFGQVLSLATWAPVAVDLISIWLYGPEAGLSAKLSKRYEVIRVPRTSSEDDLDKQGEAALPTAQPHHYHHYPGSLNVQYSGQQPMWGGHAPPAGGQNMGYSGYGS